MGPGGVRVDEWKGVKRRYLVVPPRRRNAVPACPRRHHGSFTCHGDIRPLVVGLGVMGANLALNMERNGFRHAGYDLEAAKGQAS